MAEKDTILGAGVLEIDCTACKNSFGALSLSKACHKCIEVKEYDHLRLQSVLFTKEYNHKTELIAITPFFMDVILGVVPEGVKIVSTYTIKKTGARVYILQKIDGSGYIYYIRIPETNVTFAQLLQLYKEVDAFKKSGMTENPLIQRWYLYYGILEHLLFDEHLLEININPPGYKTPIRLVHSEFDECVTNIYPSDDFLNYLSTRIKIMTGRPLNKAQPQLDGEVKVENEKARIEAVIQPFSVFGLGYSLRKHREKPWTLPLFMQVKAFNYWFAGLMSLAIAHGRTFLCAGPRGSGKTAMLGSLVMEILPKYRIITIEDTQELPIEAYKSLGYDILPLKVRSALLKSGMEIGFDTGLRTSLRLGDSCLIIGEVRSTEARVLYEAMRVGAMSNTVGGTIHSDNPYGVFDRVVNDLGVPKGSFKVTDLIIILNQIKSPTGLKRVRRVLSVTEVTKDWSDEPVFQDLLVYNPQKDVLEPTDFLLKGKSIMLNEILKRSKGYKNYNAVLKDLELRGWAKKLHLETAKNKEQLEAEHVLDANILFSKLFDQYNPLESAKNESIFKLAFESHLKQSFYLKEKE
ncbi:type II/IV secretion system ATPase subunit [Candidatus Woesearchaeota archaeon]|nr:type II/IV secretion system ATPase subunit [Candidatus Woesearchaeota archaeon]